MSEAHTRGDVPSPGSIDFKSMGFREWRTERCGSSKGGGGLLMLYKDELQAHQWDPHVIDDYQYIKKERQWLIIGGKTAFLHIYVHKTYCSSFRLLIFQKGVKIDSARPRQHRKIQSSGEFVLQSCS